MRDSPDTVPPVLHEHNHRPLLHLPTPATSLLLTSRSKTVAPATFTSLGRCSSAPSRDQWDVSHAATCKTQGWVTYDLSWCKMTTHLPISPYRSLVNRADRAAANVPLWLLPLLPLVWRVLIFTCFCPQRQRETRWTVSRWTKASWMSWTVRWPPAESPAAQITEINEWFVIQNREICLTSRLVIIHLWYCIGYNKGSPKQLSKILKHQFYWILVESVSRHLESRSCLSCIYEVESFL